MAWETGTGRLRVGIAGAGLMGGWHAVAATRAGGSVAAVADVDPQRAQRLARKHRAWSFSSVDDMLRGQELDVVHVCTDSSSHEEIARAAIAAGTHLLVEKPLAATAVQTEQILALARDRGVSINPVHQFLFQDGVRAARAALPALGTVVHMQATFCTAGAEGLSRTMADRLVADVLPHPLSLVQLFLSTRLPADGWKVQRPDSGELRGFCMAAGATVSILISTRGRPTVCAFDILASQGSIHVDLYHGYAVIEPGTVSRARKLAQPFARATRTTAAAALNLGRRVLRRQPAYPGLWQLVDAFYRSVRVGTAPPIAARDTIEVARIRDLLAERAGSLGAARDERLRAGVA